MSRLIDADALMEVLGIADECKDCKSYDGFIGCMGDPQFAWACEAITDAPTIDPMKWIPVSERLPEDSKFVLVQTDGGDAMIMCLCFETDEHDKKWCYWKTYEESIQWEMEYIVAWMPLPGAWRGEEDG